jgi:hypothetical protein
MADLNALIAQGAKFDMPNPISQMVQMQALQQGQQQNQMNQMKMQESQRGQQEMNALRGIMSRPNFDLSTPESQREIYNVAPTLAENLIRGHMGNLKTAAETENLRFTGRKTQAESAAERAKILAQAHRDISGRPDDENIISHNRDVQSSPLFTPEEKQSVADRTQRLLAMPMPDRTAMLSQQGATASELRPQVVGAGGSLMSGSTVVGTAPSNAPDAELMARLGFPSTPEGYAAFNQAKLKQERLLTPEEEAQKLRLAAAGRAPAQPRAESAPVPVVDPVTGKRIFVSRDEAISNRMTPAAAQESLSPQEIQKREAAHPQATSAVRATEENTDKLITQMQTLRDHPGLSGITGLVAGRTLALTSNARAAQALLETVMSKGTLGVLTSLRAASKTGGALGNTSNQDIALLKSGFGALNPTQKTDDFKKQIDEVIADLQATKSRVRDAYTDTYSYKSGAPATAAGQNALSPPPTPSPGAPTRANAAAASASAGVKFLGFELGTQ